MFCENAFLKNLVQFTIKHRRRHPSFDKHVTENVITGAFHCILGALGHFQYVKFHDC